MKVADYVIKELSDYIEKVFVVYGAANGDLIDAFTRIDEIDYVCTMHEQAAGFAAEGYVKAGGSFGCAIATSGPGGMNLVTPIGNCYYDSIRCLFITGQINSKFLRPTDEIRQVGFQETDIVGIVKPITKYAVMITKAEDIRFELEKAIHLMYDGRPGPVLIDIPLDIQKQEIDPEKLVGFNSKNGKSWDYHTLDEHINSFANDLRRAKRPAIIVGGGLHHDEVSINEFYRLAKNLKVPVFPTWNALDIVADDFEYYGGRIGTYGGAGRNFGIQNADLILLIGSRLSGRITGGNVKSFARDAKTYYVDIDEPALQTKYQQYPFDVNIHSDIYGFLYHFNEKNKNWHHPDFSEWMNQVREWRDKYDPLLPEHKKPSEITHPYHFARILSEEMGSNDVLIGDCGGNIVVLNHAFKTKVGQRYFTNNGNSPMGFSFAAGIGACLADRRPNGNVVCVIGDGGFNMNLQELQTLVNYGLPLKTFIIDNRIYGITKQYQETNFEGRAEACGPKGYNPPDFNKITAAYGVHTTKISGNDPKHIREEIQRVFELDGPVVCVVDSKEFHIYSPRVVGWECPIEDLSPELSYQEFTSNMIIEPTQFSKDRKRNG